MLCSANLTFFPLLHSCLLEYLISTETREGNVMFSAFVSPFTQITAYPKIAFINNMTLVCDIYIYKQKKTKKNLTCWDRKYICGNDWRKDVFSFHIMSQLHVTSMYCKMPFFLTFLFLFYRKAKPLSSIQQIALVRTFRETNGL